ncbi:porin [Vibrio sp. V09_P4A23P171]|nr:porin [Vibrio sp. V09_P4A23P171]
MIMNKVNKMKKTTIATAILTALVSGSSFAATVYKADGNELKVGGRAEFRGDFGGDDKGKEIEGTMKNKSRARLNITGSTEISDSLKGFATYEAEQTVNSSASNDKNSDFNQRYLFAGLQADFGAISVGRQDTAGVQISQMSDIGTYTGAQKEFINAGNEQINNTFLYAGTFDALNVKASFIAGEEKDTDGFGLSAIYNLPIGLGLGLGYASNDNGTGQGAANQIIAGVNYTLDDLYLGLTYTQGDLDDKAKSEFNGIEFAAQYKITSNFRLIGVYQKTENETANVTTTKSDFAELTGRYDFNKSIYTYVAYKMNNLDKKDLGTAYDAKDSIRLGLRYNF